MKRFEVGQEYIITANARPMGIASVVSVSNGRAVFELNRPRQAPRRFSGEVRVVGGAPRSESVIPADYDAIFAYNALKRAEEK